MGVFEPPCGRQTALRPRVQFASFVGIAAGRPLPQQGGALPQSRLLQRLHQRDCSVWRRALASATAWLLQCPLWEQPIGHDKPTVRISSYSASRIR
jgi:hypothetical protein